MRTLVAVITAFGLTLASLALSHGPVAYGAGPEAQSSKPAKSHTPEQLDKLLAPMALYPDPLLAQMLIARGRPRAKSASSTRMAGSQPDAERHAAAGCGGQVRVRAELRRAGALPAGRGRRWRTRSPGRPRSGRHSRPIEAAVFASIQQLRAQAQNVGTLKSHATAGGRNQDHVIWPGSDRHRADQPADRLRPAIQPDGRLHAAASRRPWSSRKTTTLTRRSRLA